MGFDRNDWLSTRPLAGVRLADVVLRARRDGLAESLATELPRLDDGSVVLVARYLTDGLVADQTITERRFTLKPCKTCGAEMLRNPHSRSWQADHCQSCNREIKRASNRRSAKTYRINNGLVKTPLFVECGHCGARFHPKRSTAQFCSTACRVAAHRARSAESAD